MRSCFGGLLVLVADQRPALVPEPRGDRRFLPRVNRAYWCGIRIGDHPACGGGRRILKKATGLE
jgi:hypothetical protein